ncbi:MAG: Crp/Fnr family transcriptional regulator [Bradyrhizobium sp.]|uniref:Crp/Fnr family transcriptional regulator n=1 Tax=Bradyrhizobium sp. TaxID=376 RepID=UPI001C297732|nr:Crp/Fnr family transcriptional regulator [Bradyrhizobium sp.]MBU6464468.1 Crp/Fnr family transcriptional regulator [Pseudomonadota bacterium]MDE2069346.1 Crp/Fnr family transcriptional regulator [Bradyrhizobium sp.]MDE2244007.1 Crp/Fnr family transcriptional regulator [Bradyrhizobium sp.]MDE2473047.1 Crp/Fnr family transcriptional regulator [Bradyrhizobium sp.]
MTALIRKLEQFVRLSPADRVVLARASSDRVRKFGPRVDITREGDRPRDVHLILSGWACRYKQLDDGRRQVVSFFLPGDMCDLNVFILKEMDHSIGTITSVTIADLSRDFFDEISAGYPRIATALWWETLVNAAIQREWTMNLGQRTASERMAHLLCEIFFRLRLAGLTEGLTCEFPLTQADLADATGLSKVHVNRTLQELRAADLVILRGKVLTVPCLERLMSSGLFNPNYLHMDREGSQLDANE